MKKIIVACGTGIATSQTVASRLQNMLEAKGVHNVKVEAIDIAQLDEHMKTSDIYVSITPETNPANLSIPAFSGIPILTGMGEEEELQKIIKALGE